MNKKPLPTIPEIKPHSSTQHTIPGQTLAPHLRKQPISKDRNRAYQIQNLEGHRVLTHPRYPALNLDNLTIPTRPQRQPTTPPHHPRTPSNSETSEISEPSLTNSVPFPFTPRHKTLDPQKSILQNPINPNLSKELKRTSRKSRNPHSTIIWRHKEQRPRLPPSPKGRTWPIPHHLMGNDARLNNSSSNATSSSMQDPKILQRIPGRSHMSYPT